MCDSGDSCEENFVQAEEPKVAAVATRKPHYAATKRILPQSGNLHPYFLSITEVYGCFVQSKICFKKIKQGLEPK